MCTSHAFQSIVQGRILSVTFTRPGVASLTGQSAQSFAIHCLPTLISQFGTRRSQIDAVAACPAAHSCAAPVRPRAPPCFTSDYRAPTIHSKGHADVFTRKTSRVSDCVNEGTSVRVRVCVPPPPYQLLTARFESLMDEIP